LEQVKQSMKDDVEKIVFSKELIEKKVTELGKKISSDYQGKNLIMIGVLKGAMFFVADLMRKISIPVIVDFIGVSSYGESTRSSGVVRIIKDLEEHIENKPVLIVEDIIDTGLTMGYLIKTLKLRKPSSIKVCALIDKKGRRLQEIPLDYVGFDVGNHFLVGYGLDYVDRYRHLPFICTLKEDRL
jgi:hypoxanthine phosphoribosyltransferase